MIVPGEHSVLAKRMRQNLAERGWTLTHYDGATLTGRQDYQAMARQARYRVILSATRVGACRTGQPSFLYNMAIIENNSGKVALAMSGVNCLTPIIQSFATTLDQKRIVPPFAKTRRVKKLPAG